MRRRKQFTPRLLERFAEQNRGDGLGDAYLPWHRISRTDPASRGTSTLLHRERRRPVHLLSLAELIAYLCISRLAYVTDTLEQFPLDHLDARDPRSRYSPAYDKRRTQGTVEICFERGIRHPVTRHGGMTKLWTFSVDQVVIRKPPGSGHRHDVTGLTVKHGVVNPRARDLLNVAKHYFELQGHRWFELNVSEVGTDRNALLSLAPFVSATVPDTGLMDRAAPILTRFIPGRLSDALKALAEEFKLSSLDSSRLLWQTVWSSRCMVDLGRDFCRNGNLVPPRRPDLWCSWDPMKGQLEWA